MSDETEKKPEEEKKAEEMMLKAIDLTPERFTPYLNLALLYIQQKKVEKVYPLVQKVLRLGGREIIENDDVLSKYI